MVDVVVARSETRDDESPGLVDHHEATGLRGIAASLIFFGHFFTNFSPQDKEAAPLITVEYFMPVTIFFVVSGFTLAVIYLGDKQREAFAFPGSK